MFCKITKCFNVILALFFAFNPIATIDISVAQDQPKSVWKSPVDYALVVSKLRNKNEITLPKRDEQCRCGKSA
jgi:hypothetical protein